MTQTRSNVRLGLRTSIRVVLCMRESGEVMLGMGMVFRCGRMEPSMKV